ncbi:MULTISPECIES: GAF domain-containing protein [Rhodococcus]|uniref:GAF domain-containing protein n=1 Tax=Rhodococcus aetherivorans TaxID=191292 RepID=A0AA46P5N8_9NOCA|nr:MULTISPECIES: GAF domain-containing protein [Rhodococcus]QIX52307.1 GAF domain-containing protein [Rhodococcus sp. DMU1]UYF95100.1 GAF domain-containing protein [Rhodococcus aetherivorans]
MTDAPVHQDDPGFRAAVSDLAHAINDRDKPRDAQYRALLDTVADITSEEDPKRLLGGIADRARRLLNADVVYLWLADKDQGYAYLGAASGGMSSELVDLRVPAAKAMTGRIIDTGMPLIVANYATDDTFSHYPQIDRVMEKERIVATVGVPLVNGTTTLGALIAANRDERTYQPSDLELLRSLASHAAIAIERTRLSEEMKRAVHSLESANRELAKKSTESERATTAHITLSQVALAGGNIDNLVNEIVTIVGGDLAVFDPDGRLLAEAGDFSDSNQFASLILKATTTRTTHTEPGLAVVPVLAAARLLGVLCFKVSSGPAQPDIEILERAAVVVALLLLLAEAEAGAAGFRRDDFIDDLLTGDESPGRLIHRGAQLKIELRRPYTVHIVRAKAQERRLAYVVNEAARSRGGLAGQCRLLPRGKNTAVVALLPGEDAHKNSQELASGVQRAGGIIASVAGAGPTIEVTEVRSIFNEAATCSDAMERIFELGVSGTMEQLGFMGLVMSGKPNIDRFITLTLGPVLDYDAQHRTELLDTLEALASTDNGPTAAAEALHIHVSTVKQRMQRLGHLLGENWRTVEKMSEIRFAIKLYKLKTSHNSEN